MKKVFTLIELIVVIAIIAILAAIIAPNAFKAIEKAKATKAIGDCKAYKTAFYAYYADNGVWPIVGIGPLVNGIPSAWVTITDNGFLTNVKSLPGWDGPYLEKAIPTHPWGGNYILDCAIRGKGVACDVGLSFDDNCYGSLTDLKCRVPASAAQKIDQTVDDGNTTRPDPMPNPNPPGNMFLLGGGQTELYWIVIWDAGVTDISLK